MNPYVHWNICLHGISAGKVRLSNDDTHGALYVYLDQDGDVSIRIQVRPQRGEDPEKHAAGLERDLEGLRRLAAVAMQAVREIEGHADQAGDDETLTCSTCGELIGMFIGHAGWQHYRGDPPEIYDAGHEAAITAGGAS